MRMRRSTGQCRFDKFPNGALAPFANGAGPGPVEKATRKGRFLGVDFTQALSTTFFTASLASPTAP